MNEMTRLERLKFWFLTNRFVIGSVIGGLSGIFRFVLTYQGHNETADTLKGIADLLAGTGGALALSGVTHADQHYAEKRAALVRNRSGTYQPFQRRSGARPDVRAIDALDDNARAVFFREFARHTTEGARFDVAEQRALRTARGEEDI